ncbi:hypothetical protein Ahy_A05g023134 isoform B [Arachis hypogaea]|uniref:Uncharacterized protein n=1 Tax=Arachis hypogaea TaxID=3818 RepID=A0A445D2Z8_ARAHY|nr:hypothetical protein Ahy_B05g074878 isoform B [Arachis hypogaea]RYR57404.1 hypothetical protein Ahy_A05g023134 isoform B [Arachis hypogaea]
MKVLSGAVYIVLLLLILQLHPLG